MRKPALDVERLSACLADRLRLVALHLHPIPVACARPVFKATSFGVAPMFVKVTEREAAERTLGLLASADGCPFLPRPVIPEVLAFEGQAVLCLEWKDAQPVDAESLTDGQLASFLDACIRLSTALANYQGDFAPLGEDDPDEQFKRLADYAARHPLVGWLLKPLLTIPPMERSYGRRPLVVIHGDLQPKNFGFSGETLAAIYDTDDLTCGLACEDAAYAFTERARRSALPASARQRLVERFRRFAELSPWPRADWLVAVNHARLRIAARRLASHPDALFVAFDIRRRDKPLRALADALKEADA